jgi:hypothetical protein
MLLELFAAINESAASREVVATPFSVAQLMEELVDSHAWIGINNHQSPGESPYEHLPRFDSRRS